MFEFNKISVIKAIEYGTNLSCIKDRFVVCRVQKNFLISHDNNKIMLEKGDTIVCMPYTNGLFISDEKHIKELTSDNFINESNFWQYSTFCTFKKFKETFEVLEKETMALESCINKSREYYQLLIDAKRKIKNINSITENINTAMLCVFFAVFITMSVCTLVLRLEISFYEILLAIVVFVTIGGFIFVNLKGYSLLNKVRAEYDTQKNAITTELDTFREKTGWYSS